MAHIHTQPGQHDPTASAFIIRTDLAEPQLWLHRHKKLNMYLQFGGHVELHETPWQAVTHEIQEESGYDIGQLKILQPSERIRHLTGATIHPYPVAQQTHAFGNGLDHFHTDTEYVFVTEQAPHHPPADGESGELKLFTRKMLAELPTSDIPDNARQVGLFIFDYCLANWEPVPVTEFN